MKGRQEWDKQTRAAIPTISQLGGDVGNSGWKMHSGLDVVQEHLSCSQDHRKIQETPQQCAFAGQTHFIY